MDRRTFLKGAGALSGLPLLPSPGIASTKASEAAEQSPPSQGIVSTEGAPGLVSVVGCGGCGVRFVSHIADRGIPDMHDGVRVEYFGIDNAGSAFGYIDKAAMNHITMLGPSCQGWPSVARRIARTEPEWAFQGFGMSADEYWENRGLCLSKTALVIIVAGLGRGFGTGFAQAMAHRARRAGALTVAMVTLPFSNEPQRVPLSVELERLERATDAMYTFSHEYAPWAGSALTMTDRMGRCEFEISQCVRNLIRTFAVPGLIGFDFQDIRPIVENGGPSWYGHAVGFDNGGAHPELAAKAVIKAVTTRKYYPSAIPASHCSSGGDGIPNAKSMLIVFSGNADTLKLKTIQQGADEARSRFRIESTLFNAYVDNTMKTGRIMAEIWMSKIQPV